LDLGGGQAGYRIPDSKFMHGRRDRLSGAHGADVYRTDDGVAAGLCLHQTGLLQPR